MTKEYFGNIYIEENQESVSLHEMDPFRSIIIILFHKHICHGKVKLLNSLLASA